MIIGIKMWVIVDWNTKEEEHWSTDDSREPRKHYYKIIAKLIYNFFVFIK